MSVEYSKRGVRRDWLAEGEDALHDPVGNHPSLIKMEVFHSAHSVLVSRALDFGLTKFSTPSSTKAID
jgi:hypothetical protein